LTPDSLQCLAGFTLGVLFPDTDDGSQPRAPGRLRFSPDLRIRLVMVGYDDMNEARLSKMIEDMLNEK